jgi:hypothetical protein
MTETLIAERRLLFSEKGESERKPLVIRIFAPRLVDPASVSFVPNRSRYGGLLG